MKGIERLFAQDLPVEGLAPTADEPAAKTPAVPGREGVYFLDEALPGAEAGGVAASNDPAPSNPILPLVVVEPPLGQPTGLLRGFYEPRHPHRESMALLRTQLLLQMDSPSDMMAIAVVGSHPGEGRSLVAAELALTLASMGRPTLLLDTDLRKPSQHRLFDIPGDAGGLSRALETGLLPIYYGVKGAPCLSVIPAGPLPHNPLELLSGQPFESLLHTLQADFDFIVTDTPPFAAYADGFAIGSITQHVLTVHRAGHTPQRSAAQMQRDLQSARVAVLGAVVTHF